MNPTLPQHDPTPAQRQLFLQHEQLRLVYCCAKENPFAPAPTFTRLPLDAQYGPAWLGPYVPVYVRAKASELGARVKRLLFRPLTKLKAYRLLELQGPLGLPPPLRLDGTTDERFGLDAVQGPSPVLLQRVLSRDEVSDFLHAPQGGSARLKLDIELSIDAGQLYLVDYGLLADALPAGQKRDSLWRERYLPSPRVLFRTTPDGQHLRPLAIRIDGRDEAAPVWDHKSGVGFEIAKQFVRVADTNMHVMATHLYRTHFVMFAVAMSMRRRLAPKHPLYVLLEPHVRFTIAVHSTVDYLMKGEQSVYAALYSSALPVIRNIIRCAARRYTLDRLELKTDLTERRMLDAPIAYPYRDDALDFHVIIERFVHRYIDSFYASDAAVVADHELAAFIEELASADGGSLLGIAHFAATQSKAGLAKLITLFVFTAGPQHAAVHFGQPDYHSDAGAYPNAAYAAPPMRPEEATPDLLERVLPPPGIAYAQFRNAHLAGFRYDRFGDYDRYPLGSVAATRTAIAELHRDLVALERTIEVRNATRAEPYEYLRPSLVPNSVNL